MTTHIPKPQLVINQSVTCTSESTNLYQIKPDVCFQSNELASPHSMSSISLCSLNQMDDTSFLAIVEGDNEPRTLKAASTVHNDSSLANYGYENLRRICDTAHGELYQCATNRCKVAIKRTNKALYQQRTSKEHGMMHSIEEDIVKEAKILYYLTVQNRPTAEYIVQYIDFIESEHSYYLITEHMERYINLKQFLKKAHQYISAAKLRQKEYHKMIKYIFWQIFAVIRWLHVDMHCCHLDLKLENIMLENANFTLNKSSGFVHIDASISPKICGFGRSEVFKQKREDDTDNMFNCIKPYDVHYVSPRLYGDTVYYDARCVDIWSLGMMLYHCCVGVPLTTYYALQTDKLKKHVLASSCINQRMIDLMYDLLKTDKSDTLSIINVLEHSCFKMYYQKYKKRIIEKSKTQKLRLMQQKEALGSLPYYHYRRKVSFV